VEAARCVRRERALSELATVTTAVSARDLTAMGAKPPSARVVPVSGRELAVERRPSEQPTVLISGNLGYRPTVEAVRWIAREIWPAVRERVAGVRWVLAGARPVPEIRRLASQPDVELHVDVPDLGAFLAKATVAIAPMASGSGIPMKVLEAWAAGVPVVAHTWTAGGLAEEDLGALVAASSSEDWIEALVRLLTDEEWATELGMLGRAVWRRRYRPVSVDSEIVQAVQAAVELGP
jgi:glycosyltransferase involved in cell wall biosynthesis